MLWHASSWPAIRARAGRGASGWLHRGGRTIPGQGRAPSCPASHGPRLDHPAAAGTSCCRDQQGASLIRRGQSRGVGTGTTSAQNSQLCAAQLQASAAYLSSRTCATSWLLANTSRLSGTVIHLGLRQSDSLEIGLRAVVVTVSRQFANGVRRRLRRRVPRPSGGIRAAGRTPQVRPHRVSREP
jgi:hypothetical protein